VSSVTSAVSAALRSGVAESVAAALVASAEMVSGSMAVASIGLASALARSFGAESKNTPANPIPANASRRDRTAASSSRWQALFRILLALRQSMIDPFAGLSPIGFSPVLL